MTHKVEALVNSFLRQNITGRASANTAVKAHPLQFQRLAVTLFGNTIATYAPFASADGWDLLISDAGWRTRTTASRLNALLDDFAPGYRIIQRAHDWYLVRPDGRKTPWLGSARFTPAGCVSDQIAC